MTKRYDDVIEVTSEPHPSGAPLAFTWRGRRYAIDQLIDSWREAGEWWAARRVRPDSNGSDPNGSDPNGSDPNGSDPNGSGSNGSGSMARDREYFRVLARPADSLATGDIDPDGFMRTVGAVYDVYLDRVRGGWRLSRIWD